MTLLELLLGTLVSVVLIVVFHLFFASTTLEVVLFTIVLLLMVFIMNTVLSIARGTSIICSWVQWETFR